MFEEVRPIASSVAKNQFLLGPLGSGSVAKLCNQLVTMTGPSCAVESLEVGIRQGLEVGLRVELAEAALAIWRRAEGDGLREADIHAIIDSLKSRNPRSDCATETICK